MRFWINYVRTWVIIKRKQISKLFSQSKSNEYIKFVILCTPRSGSNWLHTLLNSHPSIFSYGEILRRTKEGNQFKTNPKLQALVFKPHHHNIKAVGLKMFYEYFDDEEYKSVCKEVIADSDILIIHLTRKKTLAQYVSLKKAQKSQKWSHSGSTSFTSAILLDTKYYNRYKKDQLQLRKRVMNNFKNHQVLEISYEDLLTNSNNSMFQIQSAFRVNQRKLFSLLQKQSTTSLTKQIINWEDFEELS